MSMVLIVCSGDGVIRPVKVEKRLGANPSRDSYFVKCSDGVTREIAARDVIEVMEHK